MRANPDIPDHQNGGSRLKLPTSAADGFAVVIAATTAPAIRARVERSAPDAVFEWRFDELERAGVDSLDAVRFAIDVTFDVGRLRDIVARGCDAALAVTILR